jgi:hypothetical protein
MPRTEPANLHPTSYQERQLAGVIDRISLEGRLDSDWLTEALISMESVMFRSDREFLVKYGQWRMANPIVK